MVTAPHYCWVESSMTEHTDIEVKIRLMWSVFPTKSSGMTKASSDMSSTRLFCSGVPVSSNLRHA